jgi:phosphomevalonate kinase
MKAHGAASARVGGKLMICGEYSVLLPGGVALSVPVEGDMFVSIETASVDRATSESLELQDAPFDSDPRLVFVQQSVRAVRALLGVSQSVRVNVRGRLGGSKLGKLGLGTSAAVCVGAVSASWSLFAPREELTTEALFRLAHLAHSSAQGSLGSGYDVASIAMGGPGAVLYTPAEARRFPSTDWARSLTRRWLDEEWPELCIERMSWPVGLRARAIFSGQPAHTPELLSAARTVATAEHLEPMRKAAWALAEAWAREPATAILGHVRAAQIAFEHWNAHHGLGLVPSSVRSLCDAIAGAGAVARVSGAGGGDCVLAFYTDSEVSARLDAYVAEHGLTAIPIR